MVMFQALPSEAESHHHLFILFYISFWTYLYSCQHDYTPPLSCNYTYLIVLFLLTTTDITSSAVLSLCIALCPFISTFPFISLSSLKDTLPIYTGLLLQL